MAAALSGSIAAIVSLHSIRIGMSLSYDLSDGDTLLRVTGQSRAIFADASQLILRQPLHNNSIDTSELRHAVQLLVRRVGYCHSRLVVS